MHFRVLGPLEVVVDGQPRPLGTPRQKALLAILLSEANRTVPVDRLLELLWYGEPPDRAAATLQTYVSNLRRTLEPSRTPRAPSSVLRTQAPGYSIRVGDDELDSRMFEQLAESGHRELDRDPRRATASLDDALGLWRGEAYGEFGDESWATAARERLTELRLACTEDRLEAGLRIGETTALADLGAFVGRHPGRERARARLMLALYEDGRQAEALRVYEDGRRWLIEELGLDPGPELQRVQHAILAHSVESSAPSLPPRRVPSAHVPGATWEAPFIGRRQELETAAAALGRAHEGNGSVLVIEGDAGSGKSRLLAELVRRWRDTGVEARAADAGARPGSPMAPWPELLGDPAARDRTTAGLPPSAERARRFSEAVQSLSASASTDHPVLVAIDDVQLCGGDALELLSLVVRAIETVPIVVVLTITSSGGRPPDALADALAGLSALAWSRRLVLTPFDRHEIAEVVERITGRSADAQTLATIEERTGGNAFFTVELARILMANDARLDGIPPAVRDVVGGRLNRLPPPTVDLLRVAALMDRHFEIGVVSEVTGHSLRDASELLEPAEAVGIVHDSGRPGHLRFTHSLVREVVAADLPRLEACRIHAGLADALRARFADDATRASQIASHAVAALPVGDPGLAHEWLGRAARHAASALAFAEAEEYQRRRLDVLALDAPTDEVRRAELATRTELAVLLTWRHGQSSSTVVAELDRVLALATRLGDTSAAATALWGLWSGACVRGRLVQAALRVEDLQALARDGSEPELATIADIAAGATSWQRGRVRAARLALDRAREGLDRYSSRSFADTMIQHPTVHWGVFDAFVRWFEGDREAAWSGMGDAVAQAERYAHAYTMQFAQAFQVLLAFFDERVEWIVDRAPPILARTRELGFEYTVTTLSALSGWASARAGDAAGLAELHETVAERERLEAGAARAAIQGMVADARLALGDAVGTLEAVAAGLSAVVDTDEHYWEPELHRLRGRACIALGRTDEARAAFDVAAQLAGVCGAVALLRRVAADRALLEG